MKRIARQNTLALLRPMNPRGSAWKDLLTRIMKIILQEKEEFIESLQSCAQIYSWASSYENTRSRSCSGEKLEKLKKIPAWQLAKVRNKNEVIAEARNEGRTVHFASLMDLCHLKNSELEPQLQKYKGRVVPRGDHATGCVGQAADALSACSQVKMEDAPSPLKIPKSECPDIWIRLPRHKWPKLWSSMEDPVVPIERNLYGHPWQGY